MRICARVHARDLYSRAPRLDAQQAAPRGLRRPPRLGRDALQQLLQLRAGLRVGRGLKFKSSK